MSTWTVGAVSLDGCEPKRFLFRPPRARGCRHIRTLKRRLPRLPEPPKTSLRLKQIRLCSIVSLPGPGYHLGHGFWRQGHEWPTEQDNVGQVAFGVSINEQPPRTATSPNACDYHDEVLQMARSSPPFRTGVPCKTKSPAQTAASGSSSPSEWREDLQTQLSPCSRHALSVNHFALSLEWSTNRAGGPGLRGGFNNLYRSLEIAVKMPQSMKFVLAIIDRFHALMAMRVTRISDKRPARVS